MSSVVEVYEQSLSRRGFVSDPAQWRAVERLQKLYEEWTAYKAQRSNALQHLNQLPLHFAGLAQTRDVCSAAHKGLLEAEIAQAEARRALTSASEGSPQPMLEKVQAEGIAADIERSNRALALAKDRFPECEKAMRGLLREAR